MKKLNNNLVKYKASDKRQNHRVVYIERKPKSKQEAIELKLITAIGG